MRNYIVKTHPVLWSSVDIGDILLSKGLNLVSGTNGTGKSQLLRFIQDHNPQNELVEYNPEHVRRSVVAFSPKRNAQKLLFESFELPAGFTTAKKQAQIQEMLTNQINIDGVQTIRPIAEYLANSAESLINTQGYNKADAAREIKTEYRAIVRSIFPKYDLSFDWDNTTSRYTAFLVKNGLNIPFNDISEGENSLLSLSFAMNYTKDDIDVYLIDEPEVHLNWSLEIRLFKFLDNFCRSNKKQIIAATHSQVITLPPYSSYILYLYWENGELKTTLAPDKILRQDLISQSSKVLEEAIMGKNLVIYTEGNNIDYIKKAVELYLPKKYDQIEFVERAKDRTGKDDLKIYFGYQKNVPNNTPYLFVWDCDAKKVVDKLREERNIYKFIFKQNSKNNKVKVGIENLFPKTRFTKTYYENIKDVKYGGKIESFNKDKFLKDTIKSATKSNFQMFKPLIKKIDSIL